MASIAKRCNTNVVLVGMHAVDADSDIQYVLGLHG